MIKVAQQEVIHMGVVLAALGYHRSAQLARLLQGCEGGMVSIPQIEPTAGDGTCFGHLCPQKSRNQLARKIGRSAVHPRVLIDLTAKKLTPVRALLPNDLRPLREPLIVDQQRSAFA